MNGYYTLKLFNKFIVLFSSIDTVRIGSDASDIEIAIMT
jgi:hypothetical protein